MKPSESSRIPEGRGNRAWPSLALCIGIVVVVLLGYGWRWRTATGIFVGIDPGSANGICKHDDGIAVLCDFANHYFPQGQAILDTKRPVPGFYYPAPFALFMTLFALPGYAVGFWLWAAFGLLCTTALFWLPQRMFATARPAAATVYTLLLATALPVLHNAVWGQVSAFVTLLAVVTALLCHKGRWRSAAVVLAVATSVKFYPALFAIYFLIRRDFRALAIFGATALGLMVLLPALFLGVDGVAAYYASLQAILGQLDRHAAASPYSGYIANAVSMLEQGSIQPASMFYDVLRIVGYLLVGASATILYRLEKREAADRAFWAAALTFTMIPLVVGTCWAHYFVYLPLVQAFVSLNLARLAQPRWSKVSTLLLLVASVLLSNIVFFAAFARPDDFYRHGYLFVSNLLLLVALCVQARTAIRAATRPVSAGPREF